MDLPEPAEPGQSGPCATDGLDCHRASEERLRARNEQFELEADARGRQLVAGRVRMQAFFDNSLDWLSVFRRDAEGGFRYVDLNPACAAAYGLSRADVQGRRLEEVLGAEQAVLPAHHLREVVRTGRPQRYQARRTLAGRTSVIDVVFVLVTDDADPDPLIISTARDLTERTELEEQLRQALKMEAVGHLTGGVAHDFNNLLTAVISSLELIQRRSSEDRVQKLAATALRAATRGAELTAQLLAFSRKQRLDPSVVDIGALLTETAMLLRRAVGEEVELIVESAPDLWMTKVDAAQFQTAVMNLAVNARDAMGSGGCVTIGAENLSIAPSEAAPDLPAGAYVVVRVSDTGPGMSPSVLARAFEPFFTTKAVGKGSGLGLSMVHGFVTQSGGAIRIATAADAGTTVSLFLPREDAPRPQAAGPEPTPPEEAIAADSPPARILLVEDNDEVRESGVALLEALGHAVLAARDGLEALTALRAGAEVDLLLSDVVMPGGLSGPDLAIAARRFRPNLRVLLTSGYAAGAVGRGAEEFAFIGKPFQPASLARALRAVLARDGV